MYMLVNGVQTYIHLHILKLYFVFYKSPITDRSRHSTLDTFRFCLVSRHFCTREFPL